MINATKEKLASFFQGNMQYIVPFFQRSYVWNEDNWTTLWEHISRIQEESSNKHEHFIGTLIVKQRLSERIQESTFDLIDGQQRLTTFALLLKAIANTATNSGDFVKLRDKTNELLVFEDSRGKSHIRIEHSKNDKDYFECILLDGNRSKLKNKEHRILKAYNFFENKVKFFDDEERDQLRNIVLNSIPVISMLLSKDDDEQEIFDTINSLGVRLTTGELLKNFVFQRKEIQDHFEEYWFDSFEADEDTISFWNRTKTSGRIPRPNIELLLYAYLIIQTGKEVRMEKLFQEYKVWLSGKNVDETKAFLKDLKRYSEIYSEFPEGQQLNEIAFSEHEKRFFHVIENLEITTIVPLVLFIYKEVEDLTERLKMLKLLESYVVRRNVCRLTTKNYNNLFIQIIQHLNDSGSINSNSLKKTLESYGEDTNKFPSDSDFEKAFADEPIYNNNAWEILYCLALYQIDNKNSDVRKLSSNSYSVEHIMPQKWEQNWMTKKFNESEKAVRSRKIRTLGNLTLVTQPLNSKMRNSGWSIKQKHLTENSRLKITTDYINSKQWDEKSIEKRAQDLSSYAIKIWNR